MDWLWYKIVELVELAKLGLDWLFTPLHALGPSGAILAVAVLTALVTKFLSRYKTKRYFRLEKEFKEWFDVKMEALRLRDEEPEKARLVAKQIDQAKLNKVYWDYFVEGMLLNLATMYIPVLCMAAYVNEYYRPANLEALYGRAHVITLPSFGGDPVQAGAVFWYALCLVSTYAMFFLFKMVSKRLKSRVKTGVQVNAP